MFNPRYNNSREFRTQIEDSTYVTVGEYMGKVYVDLRNFTSYPGYDRIYPTQKGVRFSRYAWDVLKSKIAAIDLELSKREQRKTNNFNYRYNNYY